MARSMSLAELTKLYSTVNKPPAALVSGESLSGTTVKDKLSKLFYTRETATLFASPSALATIVPAAEQKTIAICLVIVDTLHHEHIWRHWIEQGEVEVEGSMQQNKAAKYKAKLFIHAKFPEKVTSAWVRERCVPVSYMPEWNSPEVIRAMLSILDVALRDPYCGRFLFGTESCLPIYNLQDAGMLLFRDEKSWLNAFNQPKSTWERSTCFTAVDDRVIPANAVWKSIPGWVMLARRHAADINILTKQSLYLSASSSSISNSSSSSASKDEKEEEELKSTAISRGDVPVLPVAGILGTSPEADLVRAWGQGAYSESKPGVWAPEEVFFATMLCILGYLKNPPSTSTSTYTAHDQIKRDMVTYASFSKVGQANPISYDDFTSHIISSFRSKGAIFARKFTKDAVDLPKWTKVMQMLGSPAASAAPVPAAAGAKKSVAGGGFSLSTTSIPTTVSTSASASASTSTSSAKITHASVPAVRLGAGFSLTSSTSANTKSSTGLSLTAAATTVTNVVVEVDVNRSTTQNSKKRPREGEI